MEVLKVFITNKTNYTYQPQQHVSEFCPITVSIWAT